MIFRTLRIAIVILATSVLIGSDAKADVTIGGHAPDFAGKNMFLYAYEDFISNRRILLDQSLVDQTGKFELSAEVSEIRYVQLLCDHVVANLYLQPNAEYRIEFPEPAENNPRGFNDRARTEIIFNGLELNDINSSIIDFNQNYDIFHAANYELLRSMFSPGRSEKKDTTRRIGRSPVKELNERVNGFSVIMDSIYRAEDNDYFKLYRSSVIGQMLLNQSMDRREFFTQYVEPWEFQAHHPEFTELHKSFFKFYFVDQSNNLGEEEINEALNVNGDYNALFKLMSADDFVQSPSRRDVVMSLAIEEVWNSRAMSKENMSKVLEEMSQEGQTDVTRDIAQNLLTRLSSNAKGFPAANFELQDINGKLYALESFIGTPVLLEFWASWCTECHSERTRLDQLSVEYEGAIQIISINMDESLEEMKNGLGPASKGLILELFAGAHSSIKEEYQVYSMPHYVILDSEGLIMRLQCPKPSNGLEEILFKLKKNSETSTRPSVGSKEN